jgi:GT2 family glycosyltransferase
MARVSFCVLTYGKHSELAIRSIESIRTHCPRAEYRLIVGANAVGSATLSYLTRLHRAGDIDRLIESRKNLNKCPMMRQMFHHVQTELIWWLDDDSYILNSGAFDLWCGTAERAPARTVMWGLSAVCDHPDAFAPLMPDVVGFVRSAPWYRGLPPPSWKLGGRGELNFRGRGTGDGRWFFLTGGCWLIRTRAVRELDWPDKRLVMWGEDVFLGEAIRQQGWAIENIPNPNVAVNAEPRRWTTAEPNAA